MRTQKNCRWVATHSSHTRSLTVANITRAKLIQCNLEAAYSQHHQYLELPRYNRKQHTVPRFFWDTRNMMSAPDTPNSHRCSRTLIDALMFALSNGVCRTPRYQSYRRVRKMRCKPVRRRDDPTRRPRTSRESASAGNRSNSWQTAVPRRVPLYSSRP